MTKAINVSGLHKSFGRTRALDGLDLEVESGEVHGFLGPNGAGKSTTIRVLLGLLRADSGAAQVLGRDPWKDAVEVLKANPDVDIVLMDVMMPEMDGYETTRAIREMPEFAELPIISLTAKAMKGDREKSISAGASDYITKPVDTDQLLSLMRVWLYK